MEPPVTVLFLEKFAEAYIFKTVYFPHCVSKGVFSKNVFVSKSVFENGFSFSKLNLKDLNL